MNHFIKKCTCGIVIAQCRCASPDKTVTVVSPCEHNPSPTTKTEKIKENIRKYCQPSEEKDQYGHKIIRPTIPDNAFDELEYDRIAKELKETTATPKQEEWEEKIYDLLSTTEPLGKGFKIIETDAGTANEIIDLIRQLLKEERGRVIEEIYDLVKILPVGMFDSTPYLEGLLNELEELKNG